MGKKKVMDLSIGDTTYVELTESKFASKTDTSTARDDLEKTTPSAYTLPIFDIALLKAVAFTRGSKGGKASASAVLQDILKQHRDELIQDADEYVLMNAIKKMTKDLTDDDQIKQIVSAKVAML